MQPTQPDLARILDRSAPEQPTGELGWLDAGPLWFAAPCRVIDVVRTPDGTGFTYATLPHHPETGVESFRVLRAGDRLVFEIHAVARHDFWGSRILPRDAHRVQDRVTRGYLSTARLSAGTRPGSP